jgi:hypothetical protein
VLAYSFALNIEAPGVLSVAIPSGTFKRSDGVFSVYSTLQVNAGFRPNIAFSSVAGIDNSSGLTAPFFFDANADSITLTIAPNTSQSLDTSATLAYGIGAGQLLSGMQRLPGSAAVNGGIGSSAQTAAATAFTYTLTTAGLLPGLYPFTFAQGAFRDTVTGARSCAITASLKIGFTPRVVIANAKGSDVTATWLDMTSSMTTYSLSIAPSVGYAFSAAQTDPSASITLLSGADSAMFSIANTGAASSAYTYSLAFTAAAAEGLKTALIPANSFTRSDGISNAATNITFKLGFAPIMQIVDTSAGTTDAWFSSVRSSVSLPVCAGMGWGGAACCCRPAVS